MNSTKKPFNTALKLKPKSAATFCALVLTIGSVLRVIMALFIYTKLILNIYKVYTGCKYLSSSTYPQSSGQGLKRLIVRGNGILSLICSAPEIQRTTRSTPMPKPECGTEPYLRRSKYHSQ